MGVHSALFSFKFQTLKYILGQSVIIVFSIIYNYGIVCHYIR